MSLLLRSGIILELKICGNFNMYIFLVHLLNHINKSLDGNVSGMNVFNKTKENSYFGFIFDFQYHRVDHREAPSITKGHSNSQCL